MYSCNIKYYVEFLTSESFLLKEFGVHVPGPLELFHAPFLKVTEIWQEHLMNARFLWPSLLSEEAFKRR